MCDYSLYNVRSRAAKVGDELTTRQFQLGHAMLLCTRRRESSSLPSPRDRIVLCEKRYC